MLRVRRHRNNDAVRRTYRTSRRLGRRSPMCRHVHWFVLTNNPEQCVRVVQLLSESYNPHARYGAAMAVGIACAGTGNVNACEIIGAMRRDKVDFVQQGAAIACVSLGATIGRSFIKFRDEMQKMSAVRERNDHVENGRHHGLRHFRFLGDRTTVRFH